jgi:hypothetical protein
MSTKYNILEENIMSLRRLRKLAGLMETVADEPEVNAEIERRLNSVPREMRTLILDALEVLKDAGPQGLAPIDWAKQVRNIHGDTSIQMKPILSLIVKEFPNVVVKLQPKVYAWRVLKASRGVDNFDERTTEALHQQVELTSIVLDLMRRMDSFTAKSLATVISGNSRIQPDVALRLVNHYLETFSSMLIKNGDRYKMKPEEQTNAMDLLRSLATKKN